MKRVLVFWMWNDELNAEKICQQIREFKSQNVDGFFIHPMPSEFRAADFPGGMPGYLSEYYFEMVRTAVKCAAESDMAAWLYDEGGWPSGTLNGFFRDHRPDLLAQSICADGTIKFNGFTPDLYNPEVTRIFIEATHEKYKEYVGEYFGSTIPGIFTDEPSFGAFTDTSLPFSPVMEELFRREKGYELRDAANMILTQKDEKAKLDYFEIITRLIRESFLLPIQKWCHRNHLIFTGHFGGDDCVENIVRLLGGDLSALHDCLDMPGCDAIWRQIHPLVPENDFSRLNVSAAGGKDVISETFAVYGSDLSLAEMKQVAAMQFVAGVKIIAPMALHYSDEGGRQITTVSNLFGADYRWRNYRAFADFSRRMSKVSDRTTPIIKALVPFPVNDLRLGKADPAKIFPSGLALAEKQITYNYSNEATTIPENITPDVQLLTPEPRLRTRHLRSPRGERRIFVNSSTEKISVKFIAPEGFNAWYDPADGKHHHAVADDNGALSLELPFAGTMVLLTIKGKAAKRQNISAFTNRLPLDFRFVRIVSQLKATASGLQETAPNQQVGEYFSGVTRYEAQLDLPAAVKGELLLPAALRAMCSVEINGKMETRCWAPYRWDIALPAGKSTIVLELAATPDAALHEPAYRQYLTDHKFDNVYLGYCDKFEKLFPDEQPLAGAFIQW